MNGGKRVALLSLFLYGCFCSGRVCAESREFNFKDPKGVNTISFILDSALEPIMGLATGISGKVKFDSADPKGTTGRIVVDAASVRCSLSAMTNVLHSAAWLDVAKFPTIEFVLRKVQSTKSLEKDATEITVVGDFSCKGVTREITVPVRVTHLPGRMGRRMHGKNGDLLVLRCEFAIKRSEFGIKPEMGPGAMADDIELRVAIVGWAARK